MANEAGNVSLKISLAAYNVLKAHCDKRYYTYGGFADKAILLAVDRELKNEKARNRKTNKK